jgi:hypothetical protein
VYSWISYLLFDVLEVGRFPVLLGNILVVLALIGFFGELVIASLREQQARRTQPVKQSLAL